MHAILLQKSSENKTLAHGRRSSVFLSDQPLQTMFASSLLGVLAGSSAGKHFQRGAGSEKAVCGFCEDFFCRCSSLRAFPSSMHWFLATSSLWIHHNMWPSLSWEVKNTDLLSPRRERARRTARAEPDQHLGDLTSLSYIWVERCTGILRYNSISLRLCTSDLTAPKTGLPSYAKTVWSICYISRKQYNTNCFVFSARMQCFLSKMHAYYKG